MKNTEIGLKKGVLLHLLILVLAVFQADPGMAHRLRIFAYLEGGQILGEAAFSGGGIPKNVEIVVLGAEEKKLLASTRTDLQGNFSFPLSVLAGVEGDVLFVIETGDGHRAEWKMTADEYKDMEPVVQKQEKERIDVKEGVSVWRIIAGLTIIFAFGYGMKILKKKRG